MNPHKSVSDLKQILKLGVIYNLKFGVSESDTRVSLAAPAVASFFRRSYKIHNANSSSYSNSLALHVNVTGARIYINKTDDSNC